MRRLLLTFLLFGFFVLVASAQGKTITGTVTDAGDGTPIAGATVVEKGTTNGVISDENGKYSLKVSSADAIIQFSFIGMTNIERKADRNKLNVKLAASTINVGEVVVTAMGMTRATKSLGYASQGVGKKELTQASNADFAGALQGKVAGVAITPSSGMPGASSQIVIRGARSFTGNNTPLYVVDGMPISSTADQTTEKDDGVSGVDYSNRAVDIDPNDIESINILKGQAASALYGIRASNGVVIITTKSGKGLAKGKPVVTVNTSVAFDNLSRYADVQTEYAQGSHGAYGATSSSSWGPKISDLPNDPNNGGNTANKYTAAATIDTKGKYYVPQRAAAGLDPWATPQSYNNIKNFFNTGFANNNSVSVAQAFDKSSYAFSMGNTHQTGIVPNTGMERYNAKFTAETQLSNAFKTGFVVNYANTSIDKAAVNLVATVFPAPTNYDLAGIPYHVKDFDYKQTNYRGGSFGNPYWTVNNNSFTEVTSRFYGNTYLSYNTKIQENQKLVLKYQIGADAYSTTYEDLYAYGDPWVGGNGQVEDYTRSNTTFNSLLTANYDWTINKDWSLNAIVGNEFIVNNRIYNYGFGSNFNFPGWNQIGNATTRSIYKEGFNKRSMGTFGSASASYKDMWFTTVTGREDIVSNMPRNNRSFFYPSITSSFVLSQLKGFNTKIVNFAKVRAAYAQVGQAGDYQQNYFSTPTYGGGWTNGQPIVYPINGNTGFVPYKTIYDPKLKPQNTQSYELGLDLKFLENRISMSYTYSRQNITDQIFKVPLAPSSGSAEMLTNGGKMHTNSHELSLSFIPVQTKDLTWDIGFNWTKLVNFVDELAPGVNSIMLGGFTDGQVRANVGYTYPVIYGSSLKRDANGNKIIGSDGIPEVGDMKVIGTVSPKFNLGMNTSIKYKQVTLSAVFDWKHGGQMYSGTNDMLDYYGMSQASAGDRSQKIVVDGVKEDGTKNDIQVDKQTYYQRVDFHIAESAIYDASFLKLREVALNIRAYKSSSIQIGVNLFARNILLWAAMPNMDPESSQGNTNMAGAFERFSLPQTSSYGLGLNVKF